MKQALIYNPYFDTLGGGEKYTAAVMMALTQAGYEVSVAWNDATLPQKIHDRFGIQVNARVDTAGYDHLKIGGLVKKYHYLSTYDIVFWVSDGSVPFLFGKRNILLFQVPFLHIQKSLLNQLKQKLIQHFVCYSRFTKRIIDATYGVTAQVIYPPASSMKALPKKKTILSVGRFDSLLHCKRQDVLIDAFKQAHLPGWKLILAGGDMGQSTTLQQIREQAAGAPIEFVINPDHREIEKLYGEASLYWHAAGFGIDEKRDPHKMEHFGIATVEAMSAGAVPLVYQAGGQPEIVTDTKNGYLWTTVDELVQKTEFIINNPLLLSALAMEASKSSSTFNMERFIHDFTNSCIR